MMDAAKSPDDGLNVFSNCHAGILAHIARLRELPAQYAAHGASDQVRAQAREIADFFRAEVFEHHKQEEDVLFMEMRRAAPRSGEAELVDSLCNRLTREHRDIERIWGQIEPVLRDLAKGRGVTFDAKAITTMVVDYAAHAQFEEAVMLPMSARLLSAGDKAALGLELHLRHRTDRFHGYI